MPKRPSKDVVGKYIEMRPDLAERMTALCQGNGRTFREELEHAMKRHLETPPVIVRTVTVPDLPPAEVQQPPPPEPKNRGRPRKS